MQTQIFDLLTPAPNLTTIAVGFVLVILFAVFDGLSDAYQFIDLNTIKKLVKEARQKQITAHTQTVLTEIMNLIDYLADFKKKWHNAQAIRQGVLIAAAAIVAKSFIFWFVGASVFWILHDGIVNRKGFDKPFFFVGTTATFDKALRRVVGFIYRAIYKLGLDRDFEKIRIEPFAAVIKITTFVLLGLALFFSKSTTLNF